MSLDPKILSDVLKKREDRRLKRENEQRRRREAVCRKVPRIAEIETEMKRTMAELARAAFDSAGDPASVLRTVRARNLQLQRERGELLCENGYPENYLSDLPECAACEDTGYIGTAPCECLKREISLAQAHELSFLLNTGNNNFDTFRTEYYPEEMNPQYGVSPRENMEFIYDRCWDFTLNFGEHSDNLLFSGAPGLGKTFLSGCIAKAVAAAGYSVVYDTAIHLLSCMEQEKFGNLNEHSRLQLKRIAACDLLIVDDLGSEMSTAFTLSAVYSLINDRLIKEKPMIINTNIFKNDFSARYNPQVASRLTGNFHIFCFFGNDIRQIKKENG